MNAPSTEQQGKGRSLWPLAIIGFFAAAILGFVGFIVFCQFNKSELGQATITSRRSLPGRVGPFERAQPLGIGSRPPSGHRPAPLGCSAAGTRCCRHHGCRSALPAFGGRSGPVFRSASPIRRHAGDRCGSVAAGLLAGSDSVDVSGPGIRYGAQTGGARVIELWAAFLVGLVGSLHCAGMCGPWPSHYHERALRVSRTCWGGAPTMAAGW